MIVIGIDPGSLLTGYGVVEQQNGVMTILACGTIRNTAVTPMPQRLKTIFESIRALVLQYRPDELAIETAFYGKNAQSALKLGHARGAAILAAVTNDIPTFDYSPREVKRAVVGRGTASKVQVQAMMKRQFLLPAAPGGFDTTDALAVALCHLQRHAATRKGKQSSWKAFVTAHPDRLAQRARP